MIMIPVRWTFQRKGILPIVEAKGESAILGSEPFIVQDAILRINKAFEFKGKVFPHMPSFPSTSNVSVSFSLIFPSESDVTSFLEFLQKK